MDALSEPHVLEYTYTRSVGRVIGAFLSGLRDRKILGVRTPSGLVVVPAQEYDPQTGAACDDMVEVGPGGIVTTWAWIAQPRRRDTLQRPHALALVRLDGADTAMLHLVDAGEESRMSTGMRVRPRWRAERRGHITDLECFEP